MRHRRGHEARRQAHEKLRQTEKFLRELRGASPVPAAHLRTGQLVRARIPYADGTGEKVRPGVVIGCDGRSVRVVPVTTKRHRSKIAVEIDAGTGRRSWALPAIVTIDRIDVVSWMGALGDDDHRKVSALAEAVESLAGFTVMRGGEWLAAVRTPAERPAAKLAA